MEEWAVVGDGEQKWCAACGRDSSFIIRPDWRKVGRGEKTGVRANSLTPTHELSYMAHKISLFMPRFVQRALDDDGGVWVSCLMPTRVGVSVFVTN